MKTLATLLINLLCSLSKFVQCNCSCIQIEHWAYFCCLYLCYSSRERVNTINALEALGSIVRWGSDEDIQVR